MEKTKLQATKKIHWIIWGALLYSQALYGAVIYIKHSSNTEQTVQPLNSLFYLYIAFAFIAISFLIFNLGKKHVKSATQLLQSLKEDAFPDPKDPNANAPGKLFFNSIVSWLLADVASIVSVMFYFKNYSSESLNYSLGVIGIGILALIINRPLLSTKR